MNYIVTALDAEARPLIDARSLKRDYALPYPLYRNDETLLLISGMGKTNALMAVSALLGWRRPEEGDCLINIGICGAPSDYAIGEALLIHQIRESERSFYPDILYPHSLREASLMCVDAPLNAPCDSPVDMESSAVFRAAERFFQLHRMAFIKIVSDHCDPLSVSKEGSIALIRERLGALDEVCAGLASQCGAPELFTAEEREKIERLKGYFTKSQGSALEDALAYYRLRNTAAPIDLAVEIPHSKRERNQLLERLIAAFTE
jgi:hypothetical protein